MVDGGTICSRRPGEAGLSGDLEQAAVSRVQSVRVRIMFQKTVNPEFLFQKIFCDQKRVILVFPMIISLSSVHVFHFPA